MCVGVGIDVVDVDMGKGGGVEERSRVGWKGEVGSNSIQSSTSS